MGLFLRIRTDTLIMTYRFNISLFLILSISAVLVGLLSILFFTIAQYYQPFVRYDRLPETMIESIKVFLSVYVFISVIIFSLFTKIGKYTIHLHRIISLLLALILIAMLFKAHFEGLSLGHTWLHLEQNLARKLTQLDKIGEYLFLISATLLALSLIPGWRLRCPLRLDLSDRER